MKINEKLDMKDCCGCSSCMQRCPKSAIKMKENEEGFLYPIINDTECIDCGLCVKVCPQLKEVKVKKEEFPKAYAAYNKNLNELMESSSGGIFSVIANHILQNKGVVIGAAYDSNNVVRHICIQDKKELEKLRGSKYVQSDINNTYKIAEENLKKERLVLFTGTPCQIAGLKAFLRKEYENLITTDIVCHGVPSPRLFSTYLKWLEWKLNSQITSYDFRNKEKRGWGLTAKVATASGEVKFINSTKDPYYDNFLECKTYRKSCYKCHYTSFIRESNITLADYWGILSVHPNFYNEKGVSLLIINDKKGQKIFEKIAENVEYIETDLERASRKNINLKRSSTEPKSRREIYDGLKNETPNKYIQRKLKVKFNLKKELKSLLPYQVKLMVKNIRR